ncbi:MAG: type I methionyl aminopeptidase [Caldisericia bacterium]|nr:type I methionyl aminopeptidase [Caldisericia bacterium]
MITIKNSVEIEKMAKAGSTLSDTMNIISEKIQPGISAYMLDRLAEEYLLAHGCKPAFKGLYGFPYTICSSINNEVIHGFPTKEKILKDGDIISIDIGCQFEGYFSDMARTFMIGDKVPVNRKKLVAVTEEALNIAIQYAKPGNRIGDIGFAVQKYAEKYGYQVVKEYVGHGIGLAPHEDPQIPNFGTPHTGPIIQEGMTLALEPMINEGTDDVRTLEDKWTVVTTDGKNSAHFEDTVLITSQKATILTTSRRQD